MSYEITVEESKLAQSIKKAQGRIILTVMVDSLDEAFRIREIVQSGRGHELSIICDGSAITDERRFMEAMRVNASFLRRRYLQDEGTSGISGVGSIDPR